MCNSMVCVPVTAAYRTDYFHLGRQQTHLNETRCSFLRKVACLFLNLPMKFFSSYARKKSPSLQRALQRFSLQAPSL